MIKMTTKRKAKRINGRTVYINTIREQVYKLLDQNPGLSITELVRLTGGARSTVVSYARRWKDNTDVSNFVYCSRCGIIEEKETNPLLDDNICIQCHVESAGVSVLSFYEAGAAGHLANGKRQQMLDIVRKKSTIYKSLCRRWWEVTALE